MKSFLYEAPMTEAELNKLIEQRSKETGETPAFLRAQIDYLETLMTPQKLDEFLRRTAQ
jgi:hypothetical protein